jgi:lipopolysaccharide export LptBFGC system permease protein LptF
MKKYVIMEMSEDRLKEEISDVKLGFIIAVCLCVVFMIVSVIGSILDDIHLMIGFLICSIVALCAGCYCAYKYEILKRML